MPVFNTKSYLDWPHWEYRRVKGLGEVQLNDIVVFNYPAGDTVALNYQNRDYYDLCYAYGADKVVNKPIMDSLTLLQRRTVYDFYYKEGSEYIKQNPQHFGRVVARPTDRRENYVKRCVGLPGQTLEIKDRIVYLDGVANKEPDNVQYNYIVDTKRAIPEELLRELDISNEDALMHSPDMKRYYLPLTQKSRDGLAARKDVVESVTLYSEETGDRLYPLNMYKDWTCTNYGPIWIPKKGERIELTLENLPVYERPIAVYEDNKLEVTEQGVILINGEPADSYTFKLDYYWMMGDNRNNSADSRYWGFVPEDHVVGKPVLVWLSLDKDRGVFDGWIRWKRLFTWVDNIK